MVKYCHSQLWLLRVVWFSLCSSESSKELQSWTFIYISWIFKFLSEWILMSWFLENLICGHNIWEYLESISAKNCRPVSILFVANKFFEKLVNNKLADHLRNLAFFRYPARPQVFIFNHNFDKNFDRVWHTGTLQSLALFKVDLMWSGLWFWTTI